MDRIAFDCSEEPSSADVEAVLHGLLAYNEPYLGPRDFRKLAVMARLGGTLIGGLVGETAREALAINLLWISPAHRHRGLGATLLARAEAEAAARGCRLAWLDTYDFQARPFYERRGYVVVGEIGPLARGRRRYFMQKLLAELQPASAEGA